jgi:hypothetical protein
VLSIVQELPSDILITPLDFDTPVVVHEPGEYPASEGPASEYTPSQYPESVHPPSTVGSNASQRGRPSPFRRARTSRALTQSTSPSPPTIHAVPPSTPASSRGIRSPPMSLNGSRLPPACEYRTLPTSFANAYPSPAAIQDEPRFEEKCKKKVNIWLRTGSVSGGMQSLSLDDKVEQPWSGPAQFPPIPPDLAYPTPLHTPPSLPPSPWRKTVGSNNPYRAFVQCDEQ